MRVCSQTMGTKLSSPNNRRNHPSSITANGIQNRGDVDVSSRNRSRSLEINEAQTRSVPTRRVRALDISSEENSLNNSSAGGGVPMLQSRSLPGQLFALHGKIGSSLAKKSFYCKPL